MRLKSYLKGLGLGIFVTALILSIAADRSNGDISDDEIKKRAEKLGMVSENSMLLLEAKNMADNAQKSAMASVSGDTVSGSKSVGKEKLPDGTVSAGAVSDNGEIIREKNTGNTVSSETASKVSEAEDAASTAGKNTPDTASDNTTVSSDTDTKPADNNSKTKTSDPSDVVVITVNSGESSISVATKMAEAGLVNDARQFDSYLVLSGYDRKLVVGSHPIPKGSSADEMGALLTSKQ